MNPADFIALAGTIVGRGPAGARSAVSRAYYGAFHAASDLLADLEYDCPRNGKAHSLVPQFLQASADVDAQLAGGLLSDLHSERVKADYRIRDAGVETLSYGKAGVETASTVLHHLEAFKKACESAEVVDDLRAAVAKIKQIRRI